jgi:MSHA biogenesis protein MshQ
MVAEYFDGNTFITNADDLCTGNLSVSIESGSLNASETCVMDIANPGTSGAGCDAVAPVDKQFTMPPESDGNFKLWLRAPGSDNTGNVDVQIDTLPNWLMYDWNGDGTETGPTGRATFGIFQGNPRQIYMRERY